MNGGKPGKIGAVGGIKIPPVDSYIAGYQYCANKAVPGTKTIIQYSNSFTDEGKCSAVAQNEIGSGAQVIFQVAGLCGDGALKEASKLGKWGIGVDADEYNVASRILTSAIEEDRRRRGARHRGLVPQPLPGWHGHPPQPEEQRRGCRQDQPVGAEVVDRPNERRTSRRSSPARSSRRRRSASRSRERCATAGGRARFRPPADGR